ncbi:MAG: hypothetical protein HPY71_14870 [Firmicutes bacterium]|nr:hypothetical protein [Bacillota bacterium]
MSTKLSEVAKSMGLHPSELLQCLSRLGAPFEACWPCVNDDWLLTVKEILSSEYAVISNQEGTAKERLSEEEDNQVSLCGEATLIVEKLWRKGCWGDNYVSPAYVRKMTGLSESQYKDAVKELQAREFIIIHKESGKAISLNTHSKGELDRILARLFKDDSIGK